MYVMAYGIHFSTTVLRTFPDRCWPTILRCIAIHKSVVASGILFLLRIFGDSYDDRGNAKIAATVTDRPVVRQQQRRTSRQQWRRGRDSGNDRNNSSDVNSGDIADKRSSAVGRLLAASISPAHGADSEALTHRRGAYPRKARRGPARIRCLAQDNTVSHPHTLLA
jgi:hypothetical protein